MSASPYTPQLRPLSSGEVLDAGFKLMRQRFGTLMLCVVVPVLPLSIIGTIVLASVTEGAFDPDATTTTSEDADALTGAFIVSFVLQSVALALAVAACFKTISAAYLGEHAGVGDSLRYALGRLVPAIVAYVVVSIVVGLGLIALIVPGVFLAVRWAVTLPAVVFERAGPFKAMSRSMALTRGNFWRTLGTLLIAFLLIFVIYFAFSAALQAGLLAVDDSNEVVVATISTLVDTISTALTYPLIAAVITVIYYDLRVRNEGFDLELLARGVGADASRFATTPERPADPVPSSSGFAPPQAPSSSA